MSLPALPRRAGDLLFGGHLVLALSMAFWRALESTPGLSSEEGGSFTESSAGTLLALGTLLLSGLAGLAVFQQTVRCWRDPRVCLLAASFVLALSWRTRADLLDLVYVGLSIALAAWWFKSERRASSTAPPRAAPPPTPRG